MNLQRNSATLIADAQNIGIPIFYLLIALLSLFLLKEPREYWDISTEHAGKSTQTASDNSRFSNVSCFASFFSVADVEIRDIYQDLNHEQQAQHIFRPELYQLFTAVNNQWNFSIEGDPATFGLIFLQGAAFSEWNCIMKPAKHSTEFQIIYFIFETMKLPKKFLHTHSWVARRCFRHHCHTHTLKRVASAGGRPKQSSL